VSVGSSYKPEFEVVTFNEPHLDRTRALLKAHPELRALFGPVAATAWWVIGIVAVQIAVALLLRHAPWWALLLTAYAFGAFADHALWTLIHDSTHNLVFRCPKYNAMLQILANLPIVFPAAISFRKYHLLHHRFQGDLELDADLASPTEARFVGNSSLRKALWLLSFFVWQAARVPRLKRIRMWDRWYAANLIIQIAFVAALWLGAGWPAVLYLTLSSIFAIGLHPVGARWIQEHYLTLPNQETFSYYGPLNWVAFNVGYHNEHHDLMTVAWSRLPRIRADAPEFYASLHAHHSWTRLLFRFILDPSLSLYSRRVRIPNHGAAPVADGALIESLMAKTIANSHSESWVPAASGLK
jgi:sphingolipid 4-desaturase/C4-monooxygenase